MAPTVPRNDEDRARKPPTPYTPHPTPMSSLQRDITGSALTLRLQDEIQAVRESLAAVDERIGRTLLKNGPLRVTLVALKPGGTLRSHRADGPITVQVLEGAVEFEVEGKSHPLPTGTLFSLAPGLPHAVTSEGGGVFLLTVVAVPATGPGDEEQALQGR